MNNIAVLMTCFNRKSKTISCIERLLPFDVDIYLVDDCSSDGTAEAVKELFKEVVLIQGDGNLFWNRGMHLAWERAAANEYEFYIWLNDDVMLYSNWLLELIGCSKIQGDNAIIVGIIDSHDGTDVIYGGTGPDGQLISPNGEMQPIVNMNGNVVLVPSGVFHILGNLDPVYHHDLGDVDYGYRALLNAIPVLTTRVSVASGDRNDFCRVRMWGTGVWGRLKRLYSPLGNNPRINFYFRRKHKGGVNAFLYYIYLHAINFLPDHIVRFLFGRRYG